VFTTRLSEKTRLSRATIDRPALVRSSGAGSSALDSVMSLGTSAIVTAITGTPMRKTEPHQKWSSSTPPTNGAIAMPPRKTVIITPIAWIRAFSSVKSPPSRAMDAGRIADPARPITPRATMTSSGVVANAPNPEATAKIAAQTRIIRRRPTRSAMAPVVSMAPATMKL
jgi:sugar (pentulose or hexulose) kinase